ncbi:hypothetical protein HPB50_020713 [Hyalomma asiaticum]|uniref:Uncharacterized protein n=1 Tax=Hyalomma asiaticum TaxID=266040 RepID=A0ACB7TNS8_HYAAI|nr:hypothetical protein HPB50_020713 [Hyalomma asiaticum]
MLAKTIMTGEERKPCRFRFAQPETRYFFEQRVIGSTWLSSAEDELLRCTKFQRDCQVNRSIPIEEGAHWKSEYRRLYYEAPSLNLKYCVSTIVRSSTRGNPVPEPRSSEDDDCTDKDSAVNDPLDPREKLLIFTTGSLTYVPHQVGFKHIKPFRLAEPQEEPSSFLQRIARQQEKRRVPPGPFYRSPSDVIDHLVDIHGHIIDMAISPDHRFLYVNNGPWPIGTTQLSIHFHHLLLHKRSTSMSST